MNRSLITNHQSPEIIIALDVDGFPKAKKLVDLLYPKAKIFKVGLQLFLASGRSIVHYIQRKGGRVFLDLKFYDIPNTVASATKEMVRLGVDMFTVHAQAGKDALIAAREAARVESRRFQREPPLILAVTVLTSEDNSGNIRAQVLKLARQAKIAQLDGVVCSGQEAKIIRKKIGRDFIIVTPGIRLDKKARNDQKRTVTPREAVEAGSNYLVVGRPVIKAAEPLKIIGYILKEIK